MVKQRYSQESLAAEVDIPRRRIAYLVNKGIITPAHNSGGRYGNRDAYYSELHVRELRAYLAVEHNNARLSELGQFLKETGTSITQYVRQRGLTSHA